MSDSVSGKHTEKTSNAKDKLPENNLAETASEIEKQNENNDSSSDISQEELVEPQQSSESLNDLLQYDTQVLTFDSTQSADLNSEIESSASPENQQDKAKIVTKSDFKAMHSFVEEIEQGLNHVIEDDPEFDDDSSELGVEQDSNRDSTVIQEQNERTLQLESELSDLKERLYFQGKFDRALEASSNKLKKVSLFTLMIAILALLMSLLLGTLYLNMQAELEESRRQVVIVKEPDLFPVIDPADPEIDDLQIQTKILMPEIIKLPNVIIEPKNDVSEIKISDKTKPIKLKELVKVPVKGWGVNLYSYEKRSDAISKKKVLEDKGVVADIIVVNVKSVQWYRIRVTGFKTGAEAKSYAAKIKKTLNVRHAWVSKI